MIKINFPHIDTIVKASLKKSKPAQGLINLYLRQFAFDIFIVTLT